MKSKTCSDHYIKTTTKGFFWIPVLLGIAFLMAFPVAELMKLGEWKRLEYTSEEMAILYENLWRDGLLLSGYIVAVMAGVLNSVSQFWYLYSAKKVDFYHSLPMRRSRMYAKKAQTGIVYYLVPYVIMEFLAVCIGAASGFFSLHLMGMALVMLVLHFLLYLMIYFCTALAVILTGNVLMGAICVGGLYFYGTLCSWVLQYYADRFFQTYISVSNDSDNLLRKWGSPLNLGWNFCKNYASGSTGWILVEILAVTVLAAAAAYFAYWKRPSESAGKALVYPFTQVIIRFLTVIPASFFVGEIFLSVTNLTHGGDAWWIFGLVFGLVLTHGILEVLYTMDFRKFLSHRIQLLIAGALVAFAAFSLKTDLFGYDRYLPALSELQEIRMDVTDIDGGNFRLVQEENGGRYRFGGSSSDYMQTFYNMGISEKLYQAVKDAVESADEDTYGSNTVEYVLKSGRKIFRRYEFDADTCKKILEAAYQQGTYKQQKYSFGGLDASYLKSVSGLFTDGNSEDLFSKDSEKRAALLEAFLKDVEEADAEVLTGQPCGWLNFLFSGVPVVRTADSLSPQGGQVNVNFQFYVFPEFTRTLEILKEGGYYQTISEYSIKEVQVSYAVHVQYPYTHSDTLTYDSAQEIRELEDSLVNLYLMVPWKNYVGLDKLTVKFSGEKYADQLESAEDIWMLVADRCPDFIMEDMAKAERGEYGENSYEDSGEAIAAAVAEDGLLASAETVDKAGVTAESEDSEGQTMEQESSEAEEAQGVTMEIYEESGKKVKE